jgi:predicted enzyme related to lactoylglutathione lyase
VTEERRTGGGPARSRAWQLSSLQVPITDVWRSTEFYEAVFGWRVERPFPSFEAPQLIGQWVDDRPTAPDAGPLL